MPGNAIVTIPPARDLAPAATGDEVQRLAAAVAEYADAAMSTSTRRAYQHGWRHFVNWCARHDLQKLPADGRTVAAYLAAHAKRLSIATLSQRIAAINAAHLAADHPVPGGAELRQIWSGIRRTHGRPPRQKRALVTSDLRKVINRLPPTVSGARDRAVIMIGFAGALRRSELAALELDDGKSLCGPSRVRFVAGGVEIRLDRSKTDQEGAGHVVAIPNGRTKLCAVNALRAWLDVARITSGPVFRPVDRHQHIAAGAMSAEAVASIVKRAARRVGLNPDVFAGHSLRAGFVTSAHAGGASTELIMRQTRHKKAETVMGYIRDADLFSRNAASKAGL